MTEISDEQKRKLEDLADRGFDALREDDYKGALGIAEELEELGYTAAFDIAAQAYAALDELEKAVEVLERGVRKAPACWVNWQLLGSYYSDMGKHDKAKESYEQALKCPEAWEESIRLNQAILANRCGDYETSLSYLDRLRGARLSLQFTAVRLDALQGLGRLDEALSLAEACLAKEWEDEEEDESLAYIAATRGRIRLEKGDSADEVRHDAMEAFEKFGASHTLLALIRDIDDRYSKKAKYYRLLIRGSMPEDFSDPEEASGYYVTYDVVAENTEKALGWVREYEHFNSSPVDLHIEDAEMLEKRPKDPMGVYSRTDRIYYADEDDE